MNETTLSQVEKNLAIRRGLPITLLGLNFYPIKMCHYERFLECKSALVLRLSTLPVKYAIKDYLSAVFALEIDSIYKNKAKIGLFERIINFLFMALRIDLDKKEFFKKNLKLKKVNNETLIDYLLITQNGREIKITPQQFSTKIRPLLAEQNGFKLPKESDNAEIIQSEQERNQIIADENYKLDININDLISSVAYLSHVSEKEIDKWTVREFENRKKAINRDKHYMLYGQAQFSGMVSFKNGNPAPSWCFDIIDNLYSTTPLQKITQNFGSKNFNQK